MTGPRYPVATNFFNCATAITPYVFMSQVPIFRSGLGPSHFKTTVFAREFALRDQLDRPHWQHSPPCFHSSKNNGTMAYQYERMDMCIVR